MDPFTLALATFGVQKLRGKSTKRSLRDALVIGGMGQLGGMAGVGGLSAFGQTGANTLAGSTLGAQFGNTATMTGIKSLFPQVAGSQATNAANVASMGADPGTAAGLVGNEGGSSFLSSMIPKTTAGKVAVGSAILPLLGGMGGGEDMANAAPGFNKNYQKLMESGFAGGPTGFQTRTYNDDGTYSDNTLEDKNTYQSVEAILGEDQPAMKTGGIVSVAKFNTGGQALPSKFSHSENDANNYTRAYGFVKDGAGMGDENEDTMLAQLADGEFVSRSAAVRGAGIIAGANLSDKEDQRKKGAEFFYEQQKRFKRIMDILDASRKDN